MSKKVAQATVDSTGRTITLSLAALFVVGLIVLVILSFMHQNAPVAVAASPAASPTVTPRPTPRETPGMHIPSQGNPGHDKSDPNDTAVAGFKYNSDPPTSGMHLERFADALLNTQPLPKWLQVHLLEHGNVLLQYSCTCPDIAGALSQLATTYNNRELPAGQTQFTAESTQAVLEHGAGVVVAPYPNMKYKIALTAWRRLEPLDLFDQNKIMRFINAYLANPETG